MIDRVHAVRFGSQLRANVHARSFGAAAIGTLTAVGILVSYLTLRLVNVGSLPPFVDELIYASKAQALANNSPLSLVWDGHGPSFFGAEYWLGHLIQPLVNAGRTLSVLSGLAILVLLFLVGKRLWSPWVGLTAAVLYVLSPFAITYDRMALVESFQAMLMLVCLYLGLVLAPERRVVLQFALAVVLAGALTATLLVKLSSTVVLGWIVLALLFGGAVAVIPSGRRRLRVNWISLVLAGSAAAVSWLAYRWQYQNPAYQSGTLGGLHFHARDVVLHPLQTWVPRLSDFVAPTLVGYFTPPVLVVLLVATFALIVLVGQTALRRRWDDDVSGALIAGGAAAAALVAPVFYVSISYPRYFFTAVPPLMLLGGWGISRFLDRAFRNQSAARVAPLVAAAISAMSLPYAYALLSEPATAPIPAADRVQVVTGWAGGYGLSDMAASIRAAESSSDQPALVALVGERPLWSYQLGLYMAIDHEPGAALPPYPTLRDVRADVASSSGVDLDVRTRLGVVPDVPIVALVEGGPDAQSRWLAANQGFTLLRSYSGPGMHSFAAYGSGKFAS